jgi:hypothetical protein
MGHFNMLEAYKRQHYHEILHYRCFRVETPQHRVLENTLNMGIYYQRIKFINTMKDVYANKCDASQTREVRKSCVEKYYASKLN